MISFVGTTHAAETLEAAARKKGLDVTDDPFKARLVFISEDTPTGPYGARDTEKIRELLERYRTIKVPVVLTSQVEPGFTRLMKWPGLICMAETLRIKDAMERALHPEQFIFGVPDPKNYVMPMPLLRYCWAHEGAKVLVMSYEDAEFSKIAINMFLASQVDTTNRLAIAAARVGAKWQNVCDALRCDKRIGQHAYLTPGRWQDSSHLLRDSVTLEDILAR